VRARSFPILKDPRTSKWLHTNFRKPGHATPSPRHCQRRLLRRNVQAASEECCPVSPSEQNLPPLLSIQTHSSCLANYPGQWVPSASRGSFVGRGSSYACIWEELPFTPASLFPSSVKDPQAGSGRRESHKTDLDILSYAMPWSHAGRGLKQRVQRATCKPQGASPRVGTGKQGELHIRISTWNEKYPIRASLQSNFVCWRLRSFQPLQGQKPAFPPLREATSRNSPLASHSVETPLGEKVLELTCSECFSEVPNVLSSITRELT